MDGAIMTGQAYNQGTGSAGSAAVEPAANDWGDEPVAANRGHVLPRLDVDKLKRHLPHLQRIRIEINGVLAGVPLANPDAVTEFAIGWAFMNRFFTSASQLGKISATSSHVSIMIESGVDLDRIKYETIGWIPRGDLDLERSALRSSRSPRAVSVMAEMDAIATCRNSFERFDRDGGRAGYTHVALSTADDILCMARDVVTDAAAQKVLGWILSTQADCSAAILVVRGILNDSVVEAAARAGIPIVATDAVPTAEAVAVASASCTSILGLALSHRRGLFADGGHLGDDRGIITDTGNLEFAGVDA